MYLRVRRDQRSSLLGKVIFQLDVKAELEQSEAEALSRYKFGDAILYSKFEMADGGSGLLGVASRLAFKAANISVTVDDLVRGKRIECKDIVEMLAVEEQIKEAAKTFKNVLSAAAHFGGEEAIVIE